MLKGIDGIVRKVYPGWSGRIKVDKTRVNANEGKEVLLPFTHGLGFDSKSSTINSAFGLGLIVQSGAIYTNPHLPDGKMKGKDNVIKYFLENQEVFDKLNADVLSSVSHLMDSEETDTEEDSQKIDTNNL